MDLLILGIKNICTVEVIPLIIFGVFMGVIFGALPGVSATMAIILSVGFTYSMSPVVAIALLSAVYCSAITGGGITAILFKIPGTWRSDDAKKPGRQGPFHFIVQFISRRTFFCHTDVFGRSTLNETCFKI